MERGRKYSLVTLTLVLGLAIPAAGAVQLTADVADQFWGPRNCTCTLGNVVSTDGSDVFFYDTAANTVIQPLGALETLDVATFGAGSGATAGDAVGFWRRGTAHAWVLNKTSGGTSVLEVLYANPFDPGQEVNPEGGRAADGCVFLILQSFDPGTAQFVKQVVKADAATAAPTLLSSPAAVPGASRVASSACEAAWSWDDGSGTNTLEFYNGSIVSPLDTGTIANVQMNQGHVVYIKDVGGVTQTFRFDTNVAGAPVALSSDAAGFNSFPQTDSRHIVWLHNDGSANQVVLDGGLQLTDGTTQLPAFFAGELPLTLHRGQLVWQDAAGTLRYYDATRPTVDAFVTVEAPDIAPATTVQRPCVADGIVTWYGLSNDGGTDTELFSHQGTPPADAQQPSPPMLVLATPGDEQISVTWDRILGATSYNLYVAKEPGVTKDNYSSLLGGTRIVGVTSPAIRTGLTNNRPYYFVVTALEGASEGPNSHEAQGTPLVAAWEPVGGLAAVSFRSVAADPDNRNVAYAGSNGNTYKSTDRGANWTPLTGGIETRDIRALAVTNGAVVAATRIGELLRSLDGGASWNVVASGVDIGEQNKSLAADPNTPATLYAGDFQLPGYGVGDSYVVKSIDSGATWNHLPQTPVVGGEIHAYGIAIDPATGSLYAGGTGTPNMSKSIDGGTNWTDAAIPGPFNYVYALVADPLKADTLYAGVGGFAPTGFHPTIDGGATWLTKNAGLPVPLPQIYSLLADPARADTVFAGTDQGFYLTRDGGEHWRAHNGGLTNLEVYSMTLTKSRHLIAATAAGLFRLDLHICDLYYADLNETGLINAGDAVILANYLVGNLAQGAPPFTAPLDAADLDQSGVLNAVDAVILSNFLVGNITCLPTN